MHFLVWLVLICCNKVLLANKVSESPLQMLSYTDVNMKMKVFHDLNARYSSARQEMNATLSSEIRTVKKIHKAFVVRLEKMEGLNGAPHSNLSGCITKIKRTLAQSPGVQNLTTIIAKAAYEKKNVYDKLLADIYNQGRKNVQKIAEDVLKFGIESDCEKNETCFNEILDKISDLPNIYEKEQQIVQSLFLEQEYNYKDRVQDYTDELKMSLKPYLIVADQCLRQYFMSF